MRKQRHTAYQNCPVEVVLDLIGGKWKSMILFHVAMETRRFNQLRRLLPAVTQRILTQQLRELESDGLISRTIHAEVPPRVDYAITPLGASLGPILASLKEWAETHVPERIAAPSEHQEEQA